jgi:hypothetical protein
VHSDKGQLDVGQCPSRSGHNEGVHLTQCVCPFLIPVVARVGVCRRLVRPPVRLEQGELFPTKAALLFQRSAQHG